MTQFEPATLNEGFVTIWTYFCKGDLYGNLLYGATYPEFGDPRTCDDFGLVKRGRLVCEDFAAVELSPVNIP